MLAFPHVSAQWKSQPCGCSRLRRFTSVSWSWRCPSFREKRKSQMCRRCCSPSTSRCPRASRSIHTRDCGTSTGSFTSRWGKVHSRCSVLSMSSGRLPSTSRLSSVGKQAMARSGLHGWTSRRGSGCRVPSTDSRGGRVQHRLQAVYFRQVHLRSRHYQAQRALSHTPQWQWSLCRFGRPRLISI